MGKRARLKRLFIKQSILLVLVGALIWFGIQAARQQFADRDLIIAQFVLPSGKRSPEYRVRVAKSDAARRQGLMYVKSEDLEGGRGMLFAFPTEKAQSFWMRNTPAPLDIIFINAKREVVGLLAGMKPYSTESRSIEASSTYALELLAGTAAQDGIVAGAKLILPEDLPIGE